MGLQPPRGVTREEVVNICVCNFLLIITVCGAYVLFLCTVRTKLLVLFFRASVFLLHLRLETSQGVFRKDKKGTV